MEKFKTKRMDGRTHRHQAGDPNYYKHQQRPVGSG